MTNSKAASRMTPAIPSSEWYTNAGWKVFNNLLCELEQEPLNRIWVENFDEVGEALKHISKKELVALFNVDSVNWRLSIDQTGTLYATRT